MLAHDAYRLSPYCVLHADPRSDTATLVHALYGSRFVIAAEVLSALAAVHAGASLHDVLAPMSTGAQDAMRALVDEHVLVPANESDAETHDASFDGRLDPIELAVHRGFNEGGYVPGELDPQKAPAVAKRISSTKTIALDRHASAGTSMDLIACLQTRRSVRTFGKGSLSKRDFERFLQFSFGVQALIDAPAAVSITLRPYPSGGALHPLEIYSLVYRVESIEPGLYHYDPFAHRLALLPSEPDHRSALASIAMYRLGQGDAAGPAMLLLVCARFNRTCWKYRGMAYQAILMETGAVYQTMYLVATLLGLAPCAVGAFPERAVAEILGVDSRDESQVGMFALGTRSSAAATGHVTAVRGVDSSPFARADDKSAIELAYADGTHEILRRDRVLLERPDGDSTPWRVKGPRGVATLAESARANLVSLLERSDA
jgi:SagB-type dehydrogenase family enzyme